MHRHEDLPRCSRVAPFGMLYASGELPNARVAPVNAGSIIVLYVLRTAVPPPIGFNRSSTKSAALRAYFALSVGYV